MSYFSVVFVLYTCLKSQVLNRCSLEKSTENVEFRFPRTRLRNPFLPKSAIIHFHTSHLLLPSVAQRTGPGCDKIPIPDYLRYPSASQMHQTGNTVTATKLSGTTDDYCARWAIDKSKTQTGKKCIVETLALCFCEFVEFSRVYFALGLLSCVSDRYTLTRPETE